MFTVTVVTLTRTLSKYTWPPKFSAPPSSAQLTRPVTHAPTYGARFVTPNLIHVPAVVPFVSFADPTTLTDVDPPTGVKNSSRNCAYAVVPVIRFAPLGVYMYPSTVYVRPVFAAKFWYDRFPGHTIVRLWLVFWLTVSTTKPAFVPPAQIQFGRLFDR